ncbi:major facilitator superfamily domain-containing protein [Gilbertella persicaria]|uniref:major facilitator superfamily domain-containing protein n=1 Tax=Gilbertella persicaria TaxID=101096 RepID=UPI002220E78D|nr:major facilitator superfamily domain-containing protein [Gilbertella persicaria]KAI8098276.1 major facilitator superfamily domain-containing protein [Gilbertella persicaria]
MAKITEATPLLDSESAIDKKPSPWYIIIPAFGIAFYNSALIAPSVELFTMVFCYRYYQPQTEGLEDIPIENCAIPEVQSIVSRAQAIIMLATYLANLLMASYYGSLLDKKGRRLVLQISSTGNTIAYIFFILTIRYINFFGISLFVVGPILCGLLGGDTMLLATSQAYIADCTTTTQRTIVFGHFIASLYLGGTLGSSFASYLIKSTGSTEVVFWMALTINVCLQFYVHFVLPESHKQKQLEPNDHKTTLLKRAKFLSALDVFFSASSKYTHQYTLPLAACIYFLALLVVPPILMYAMLKFGWTAYEGGIFTSIAFFTRLLIMIVLLPYLSKLFHKNRASTTKASSSSTTLCDANNEAQYKDEPQTDQDIIHAIRFDIWMIRTGIFIEAIGLVVLGLVTTPGGFMFAGVLQSFGTLSSPSIRSLQINLVDASQVGKLMSALAVLESMSSKYI